VTEPYRGENSRDCPLCGLPHRIAAVTCDQCGQRLDERPDLDALRAEYNRRKRDRLAAIATIVTMLGLNIALFRGAAYVVLVAPVGWVGWNEVRLRFVRKALDRASARARG
jgi:hypothetical protein